jgi:cytochrome c oxidase subunit I+III
MHILGLWGMPRRIYTYSSAMGWGGLNMLATIGAFLIAFSVGLFIVNVVRSRRYGALAGPDPWRADTLEWRLPSPPPFGNTYPIPVVTSRSPMWEPDGIAGEVKGLASSPPEILVTSGLDAHPDHRAAFPTPTVWPLISAIATTVLFIGSIFTPWAVVWGSIPVAIAMTIWFWPTVAEARRHRALEKRPA